MRRHEIVESLKKQSSGDFVTRKGVQYALGYKDPHSVDQYLVGLEYLPGKRYSISDVADAIMRKVERRNV